MRKCFLIKYKTKDGNIETLIDRDVPGINMENLVHDIKNELQRQNEVEYPTFAIEEISEEQFCYFKKKGYYNIGD